MSHVSWLLSFVREYIKLLVYKNHILKSCLIEGCYDQTDSNLVWSKSVTIKRTFKENGSGFGGYIKRRSIAFVLYLNSTNNRWQVIFSFHLSSHHLDSWHHGTYSKCFELMSDRFYGAYLISLTYIYLFSLHSWLFSFSKWKWTFPSFLGVSSKLLLQLNVINLGS